MVSIAHLNEGHRRELTAALNRYIADDRENRLLNNLPARLQAAGRIDQKEDFLEIVRWRASRQAGNAAKNRPEKIREVTQAAFSLASEGRVLEAVRSLRAPSLAGVGTRVGTAILLFFDPDRYTVLDKLAWRSLIHFRVLDTFDCWFEEPEDCPPTLQSATWTSNH